MTNFFQFIRDLLQLTKFEIVVFEVITLVAGYFIGQSIETSVDWLRFFLTLFGVFCLASGSGALNQIQERDEDAQMNRTKNRPLPSGRISFTTAIILTLSLFIAGSVSLYFVNLTALLFGLGAVFSYNCLYTMWWKRTMAFGAVPGAIPGALPILIGYQAATQNLSDLRGYYLFSILFFWQMPHFWVLALKYSDDYDQGGFPTLPVAKGNQVTRFQISLWCLAYAGIGLLSSLFFPMGIIGVGGALFVSAWLLYELFRFLNHPEQKTWLRFFLSINFSMILYIFLIAADLWSIYLHPRS